MRYGFSFRKGHGLAISGALKTGNSNPPFASSGGRGYLSCQYDDGCGVDHLFLSVV
jgi:hypothetical protein